MRRRQWRMRHVVMISLILGVAAGCAGTPPPPLSPPAALQPADLAKLAGTWTGSISGSLGTPGFAQLTRRVQVTVGADGTFTSNVDGVPGRGTARIADGKLVYEGSGNRGTATLHDRAGTQVIRGEGTLVGMQGWSTFEVVRQR